MSRQYYNEKTLRENYLLNDGSELGEDEILYHITSYVKNKCKPSKKCMKGLLNSKLPILNWTRKIDFKNDLLKDLIVGLTVGVIQIAPSKLK